MTRNILVTGGAGYVGSHVAGELVARGDRVVVVDNLSTGHRDLVPAEARLMELDLADATALRELFGREAFDGVMHFASHSLVGDSMKRPFTYLGENFRNGLNVIQAAAEGGVPKLILSSTANLFGQPQRIPIDEDEPIRPGSPYGESKRMLERALYWAEETHGLRYGSLRYFNAAGAHPDAVRGEDHDPETHLIPLVLQVALGLRREIQVFGDDYPTPDGTCVRDYVHVVDLAQAHILVLDALDRRSVTYNLGNGRGHSVQEVVECARRVTGHAIPARVAPRRAGDPAQLVASSQRIRDELGWRPRYAELQTIVETAWRWHRARHGR